VLSKNNIERAMQIYYDVTNGFRLFVIHDDRSLNI
jgi:hypothetical protein